MNRVRNANGFIDRLRICFDQAAKIPKFVRQPLRTVSIAEQNELFQAQTELLEFHAREYTIDVILEALNWSMKPPPDAEAYRIQNLAPEVSLSSAARDRRRFLDYLGFDSETIQPLLVVEAKRPRLELPYGDDVGAQPDAHGAGKAFAEFLGGIPKRLMDIVSPVDGLNEEWRGYLTELADYIRSLAATGIWPRRVAMANGNWLIVFTDPRNAFGNVADTKPDRSKILVFSDRETIINHGELIFEILEYGTLSQTPRFVEPGEVPFIISPEQIEGFLFGVGVVYAFDERWYQITPRLTVVPILLLRSSAGTFLQVTAPPPGFDVPLKGDRNLQDHLALVAAEAQKLCAKVKKLLAKPSLTNISVEEHYRDTIAFSMHPGVGEIDRHNTRRGTRRFVVVTGQHTHFIVPDHEYSNCPFHRYAAAADTGVSALRHPIGMPSVDPKSYFVDGTASHCAHRNTLSVKSYQLTIANRSRCGNRSAQDSAAFCEIWDLDNYICCRSCVFKTVCDSAEVFHLPCVRNVHDEDLQE